MQKEVKKQQINQIFPGMKIRTFTDLMNKCNHTKILVVDDYMFNFKALEIILKRYNLQCDYAANGKQALEKIISKENDQECSCYY